MAETEAACPVWMLGERSRRRNRRRRRRYWVGNHFHGCVLDADGRPLLPAAALDVSPLGVRLVLRGRASPGAVLSLLLCNRGCLHASALSLRVCFCLQQRDGTCVLGGEFLRPLKAEEMRALLA